MIATLTGEISEKQTDTIVLEVGGVGYGLYVSYEDHGALQTGETVKLYIYEHIRENAHDLFGFSKPATKQMFEMLLGVNGVGSRMALSILSIGNLDQVKQAIASGDTKYISRANGVGKRVAERVVVDLKDKVGLVASSGATDFLSDTEAQADDEATQALMALGYSLADANKALKGVDPALTTEERIKQALAHR